MSFRFGVRAVDFGKTIHGESTQLFTFKSRGGLVAKVTNYGGIVTSLMVPDKNGKLGDVVLGYDNLSAYEKERMYFGAIVGRIAGRLVDAQFTLDGQTYEVAKNEGDNHIHGGIVGLDRRVWKARILAKNGGEVLELKYDSPDGEEGYPGNLQLTVEYSLTDEHGLRIDYSATTDKATPLCLTNHSYFNLAGDGVDNVLGHVLQINADKTVGVDERMIANGSKRSVEAGVNDFRTPAKVGDRINKLFLSHGDNYLIDNPGSVSQKVAVIFEPGSGRSMEVYSTATNLQFYTSKGIQTKEIGKSGRVYKEYDGFCLECQGFADATNHPNFPSIILEPGKVFRQTVDYKFSLVNPL